MLRREVASNPKRTAQDVVALLALYLCIGILVGSAVTNVVQHFDTDRQGDAILRFMEMRQRMVHDLYAPEGCLSCR